MGREVKCDVDRFPKNFPTRKIILPSTNYFILVNEDYSYIRKFMVYVQIQ